MKIKWELNSLMPNTINLKLANFPEGHLQDRLKAGYRTGWMKKITEKKLKDLLQSDNMFLYFKRAIICMQDPIKYLLD